MNYLNHIEIEVRQLTIIRGTNQPISDATILSSIDRKKSDLDRRRTLEKRTQERLLEEFEAEYTYHSIAIEGNCLTLQETARVLQGMTIDTKPLKDHLEAVGHRDAFRYVQQMVSERVRISERLMREIHALVLIDRPSEKGVFRNIPVHILGALHDPPQPYLVPVLIEQLLAEHAHSKRHPVERAAIFHLDFEGIHPFVDGNGRAGRLLMNLDLMREGYPPIMIRLSDQQRYYDCFEAYYLEQDAGPMVRLIGEAVEEQLDRYLVFRHEG